MAVGGRRARNGNGWLAGRWGAAVGWGGGVGRWVGHGMASVSLECRREKACKQNGSKGSNVVCKAVQ